MRGKSVMMYADYLSSLGVVGRVIQVSVLNLIIFALGSAPFDVSHIM